VSDVLTSEEAERAVLGAMMLDGGRVMPLARGVAGLTPEAFGIMAHRIVAEAMWAMAENSKRYIDMVTVQAELERLGKLDAAGGVPLLLGLIDDTPTAAHAEYYIQIVREKWLLRKAMFVTQGLQADIHAGPENVEEFVRQAPDRFTGLMGVDTQEASNIEVMDHNIERWEDAVAYRQGDASKAPAIGLSTPFAEMTEMLCGLEPGITIIAGRPSAGKTTLEDMLSHHVAKNGIAVGRVTLDSTRASLLARAQCRIAGVSMPKLKHGFGRRDQIKACRDARNEIGKLRMWIRTDLADVASIRMWALERKRKDGMGMLTIDYAQQVRASELGRAESDRVARMTHVIARLKKLALDELEIPVLVLSQLNRQSEKDGNDPGLNDLRDSGALEQDADKVIMLYIDKKKRKEMDEADPTATKHKRPVVFGVAKHKDGETGSLPLWMYPPYFRFEVADDEWADDGLPGDQEELEREFSAVPRLRPRDEIVEAPDED
jgi:replicative DNA helicase